MAQNQFCGFFTRLDFYSISAHARLVHGARPEEILGEAWLAEAGGLTEQQLFSRLRREYFSPFSQKTLSEMSDIFDRVESPLEILENLESKTQDDVDDFIERLFGEVDSKKLAARLGVGVRRAQQLIAARRAAVLAAAAGREQLQLEIFQGVQGVLP
jgi:hypothetical protein